MTPKEKAKELVGRMVDTYYTTSDFCYDSTAKQCALITVDEIIYYLKTDGFSLQIKYWQEVKQEIEKL